MYNSPMETVVENVLPFLSDYIKCIKKDANAVTGSERKIVFC
jgi:hypothetical protein